MLGNLFEIINIYGYEVLGNVRYKNFLGIFLVVCFWLMVRGYLLVDIYVLVVMIGNVFILKVDYDVCRWGFILIWFLRFVINMYYEGYFIYYL